MGSINFNNLKNVNTGQFNYTYADIFLDMAEKPSPLNRPDESDRFANKDVKVAFDINAIKNSIVNLFNTVPGDRFLLPDYGCDLRQFIFDSISDFKASLIEDTIRRNIDVWEPRVSIVSISVKDEPDMHQYTIDLVLAVPFLQKGETLNISGLLNREGFITNA